MIKRDERSILLKISVYDKIYDRKIGDLGVWFG
jgi:hypothetical protein